MTWIIRDLLPADLAPAQGFAETLSNLKPTPALPQHEAEALLQDIQSRGTVVLVATTTDGQIVGTLMLLLERKFLRGGALAGHIEDVATRKGYEGQGIGRALVDAAIARAQAAGCYKVILDCDEKLAGFYGKSGFVTFGIAMRKDF